MTINATNKLETFSSEKVADVLKRLFILRKKADTMIMDYYKFEDKYDLTNKVEGNIIDDFFQKFWELRKGFFKDRLKEDKVLKDLNGINVI